VPARAELQLAEVLDRMDQVQKSIKDISFSYTMHARQGQFQGRTRGDVLLLKPSQLKVKQKDPEKLTILTEGTTLRLYSPKQQQVLIGDWKRWVHNSKFPLALLNFVGAFNAGPWQDRYEGHLDGHADHQYQLRFTSRSPDAEPDVDLTVSDNTFLPVQGTLHAPGLTAQVQISAIRTNTGLKTSDFAPVFPEGTVEVPVAF
jgi:outer membrane lipoprotein-sorting protein